jgi:hypothetical protein
LRLLIFPHLLGRLAGPLARLPNLERCHSVTQQQQDASTDMPTNRWQAGKSGNPAGRTRGSRNRLSEEVICALLRDFLQHGQEAVARVRRAHPATYLKILALLVPREHKVEHSTPAGQLSDEELEAMIAELQERIAARAAATELIEGKVVEHPALLAPAADPPTKRRNTRGGRYRDWYQPTHLSPR